jgi:enediyne polyketide synthase
VTVPIAVIGLACRFPEADSPDELWENALRQRRAFRQIPPERLRLADYYAPDSPNPDMLGTQHAAVLDDYEFDRVAFRVGGSAFRSADMTHWLALDVATQALADAGLTDLPAASRERAGVIVGNTLTGEFSRTGVLRLRWPYVRRVVSDALARADWGAGDRLDFMADLEDSFKRPFPPVNEDTLAGALSNTIAGRICNVHDLHGGGYAVDGACSSSLLAVINGATALASHDLDLAIVGGVDLSLDPFELIGFARTHALATNMMRVYDLRAEGFWPGEGCGFAVLARLEDAQRWDVRVHATIRGWGISSDGSGGLTRPEASGQFRALQRAYDRAGYSIRTVPLFEGHGTGTPVGDAAEIEALTRAIRAESPAATAAPAALSSIKSNIGHTKAAAGMAGLLKAIMAVQSGVLPPATGCERPRPELTGPDAAVTVLDSPAPWPAGQPLRAGVSAMGFGGINTHVAIEGAAAARPASSRPGAARRLAQLNRTHQDAELIPLAAASAADLARELTALAAAAGSLSFGDLSDLAIAQCAGAPAGPARAAVLAASPAELAERLAMLRDRLAAGEQRVIAPGAYLAVGRSRPRIGLLLPGQGAPVPRDAGALGRRFPAAARLLDGHGRLGPGDPRDTRIAQPAIVAATLAGLAVLDELGITATAAVGHSVGELAALSWAGVLTPGAAIEVAAIRGAAMAALPGDHGTMAELAVSERETRELIAGTPVTIAADNGPRRQVIAGPTGAVAAVTEAARARGLQATMLPVSYAFHSSLVEGAAGPLLKHLEGVRLESPRRRVISTITGGDLPPDADLRDLLGRQVTAPVRFSEAWERLSGSCDLIIEAGPGHVLTRMTGPGAVPVIALDVGGQSLAGVLEAAGACYALGAPVRLERLARDRVARSGSPLRRRVFLANPCEQAPDLAGPAAETASAPAGRGAVDRSAAVPRAPAAERAPEAPGDPLTVVRAIVAERAELPLEVVTGASRLLSDLRLNSITVAEIAARAAAQLGVTAPLLPTEVAGATLADLAEYLSGLEPAQTAPSQEQPAGVGPWLAPFALRWQPRDSGPGAGPALAWDVRAPAGHPLAERAAEVFGAGGQDSGDRRGLLICVPAQRTTESACWLLSVVQEYLAGPAAPADGSRWRIAVLHDGAAGGLIRTLALEHPELAVRLIELPADAGPDLLAAARAEAERGGPGIAETRLTADGALLAPALEPCWPVAGPPRLTSSDVLLVSGGGKGIGAECAMSLARQTGAALGVIGRSDPAQDADLAASLGRLRAGVSRFCYARADVTDAAAVQAAVAEVTGQLGTVTALVHAAGNNQPQPLSQLSGDALRATLAPKVDGLRLLLDAAGGGLRLLVAFGSIIARMGLPGEGHYALANDWLAREVEEAGRRLPGCRCLTIEWSVWAGTGMGERLGRIDALARAGVTAISPDEGTRLLQSLIDGRDVPATVVAAGRFGEPPTLRVRQRELPLLRFLERPRVHCPGIELVTDATMGMGTDSWIADHALDGTPLLPAAVGLEAMAQAAGALAAPEGDACPRPASIGDVELLRPVTIPADGRRTIRIAALRRDASRFDVVIRSDETGFAADHFRAVISYAAAGEPRPVTLAERGPVPLDIQTELYGPVLFHGPAFQRVTAFRSLHAWHSVAEVQAYPERSWFGQFLPQQLVLGDPGCRDAIIHAEQACIPHRRCLPARVQRITFRRPLAGRLTVSAVQRAADRDSLTFDLTVRDAQGLVCEEWQGLTLSLVAPIAAPESWPAALLVPYVERRAAELGAGGTPGQVTVALEVSPGADGGERPARREQTAAALATALGRTARVRYRPDGRPEVDEARAVSSAHAGGLTFAAAGRPGLACDLEPVTARSAPAWRDLLGPAGLRLAELVAAEQAESLDTAATRVWVAGECLRKAGRRSGELPVLGAPETGGWVMFQAGFARIATLSAPLAGQPGPIVLGLLGDGTAGPSLVAAAGRSDVTTGGQSVPLSLGER